MPRRPKRPCPEPLCKNLTDGGRCEEHRQQEQRRYDKERGTSTQRGYGPQWRKLRLMVLNEEPLCRECQRQNKTTPATEVDHIDGDVRNLHRENLQPLCRHHHSQKTVREQGRWGGHPKS